MNELPGQHVFNFQEMLGGKYPIPKVFGYESTYYFASPVVLRNENPVFAPIEGVPPVLNFGSATDGLSEIVINNLILAEKMYMMFAFQAMVDYILQNCFPPPDFIKKSRLMLSELNTNYYSTKQLIISLAVYDRDVATGCINEDEARIKEKLSLVQKIVDKEDTDEKNDYEDTDEKNDYSTQDKIKFVSYFFIALGILGTAGVATLVILSSQKVMELSLKSAAFLAPAIASVAILLIATIVVLVMKRSQKTKALGKEGGGIST
jgi:hypothetical protein